MYNVYNINVYIYMCACIHYNQLPRLVLIWLPGFRLKGPLLQHLHYHLYHHCTMRFRKKRTKNVQLWTLVSSRIFIEKSWNFSQSCLNSSRIWGLFFGNKRLRKKWGKNQKTCWGCFRKSRLVSKKFSRKKNFF